MEYIKHATELNLIQLNNKTDIIKTLIRYNFNRYSSDVPPSHAVKSKWFQLSGLVCGGLTFALTYCLPSFTGGVNSSSFIADHPSYGILMGMGTIGMGVIGALLSPIPATLSIKRQFTHVTKNIHSFFNQMNHTHSSDEKSENYFNLAGKILDAVRQHMPPDNLIHLIDTNMQNMYINDKVIRNDIENEKEVKQERFLQRLLDTHVGNFNLSGHKHTLREYLRSERQLSLDESVGEEPTREQSRLSKVEDIVRDKLVKMTTQQDNSEEEIIENSHVISGFELG